jgi:general stress protein 26
MAVTLQLFIEKSRHMNSIHENQKDETIAHLSGTKAVEKIREMVDRSGTCFFRTDASLDDSHSARPMSVQKTDANGDLWFISAIDSKKNRELAEKPNATLFFQGSEYSDFLELIGTVRITQEKSRIDELWDSMVGNWFTEGKDDPRVTVLQFTPTGGYYWDNKHGDLVAGVKIMIGAITGNTMDDSIEGKIEL